MHSLKVYESEYRFCLILWENEPIKSRELALLCEEKLGWKPTTTYTVIKRLSDRGILKNEKSIVSSLVSQEEVQAYDINELVQSRFNNSQMAFLNAFTKSQKLNKDTIAELQVLIDRYREENQDNNE